MKSNKYFFFFFLILIVSCHQKKEEPPSAWSEQRAGDEARAQRLLMQARSAFFTHDLHQARNMIDSLRSSCQLALNAREEAILLLDSIDIKDAETELVRHDSILQLSPNDEKTKKAFEEATTKVKFYHRKLEHDISEKQMH